MEALAPDRKLPSLGRLMKLAYTGGLAYPEIEAEFSRQFDAFEDAMGRGPDFVDGHHHVHQLPVVRRAMLGLAVKRLVGPRYVRICRESIWRILRRNVSPVRAMLIGEIGIGLKSTCAKFGLRTTNGFSGVYDFSGRIEYDQLFARFCTGLTRNGLIMCHPGYVDEELRRADSLTDQRTVEHDFLGSDGFLETLKNANLEVARYQYNEII